MALPPCHLLYQFIVKPLTVEERRGIYLERLDEKWRGQTVQFDETNMDNEGIPRYFLDLNMYQRSCDTFLGVPFNVASMSLLLMLVAQANNMVPGEAFWIGGDTHLYIKHLDAVNEQLSRTPKELPQMKINKEISTLD